MARKKKSKSDISASNEFTTLEVGENLAPESSSVEMKDSDLDDLLNDNSAKEALESKSEFDGDGEVDSHTPSSYDTKIEESSTEFLPRLTPEMKDKLEKIDTLEKHCIELEEENSKLTDSINAYLEELEQLKDPKKKSPTDDSILSLESLKEELVEAKKEISSMRKSLQELREENDNYLMKISELTFENAKLTSQLQELEKSLAMAATPTHHTTARKAAVRPSQATMQNQPKFANPYLQNGYQDW